MFQKVKNGEEECIRLQDQLRGRLASMDKMLDRVGRDVLGPEGAALAPAVAVAASTAAEDISKLLPRGFRLGVLGGTSWKDPSSKLIVEAIAHQLSVEMAQTVVVLTTGLVGVQETLVRHLGREVQVVNLVSSEDGAYGGIGQDIDAGPSLENRMLLFGQLADAYLTVEGGPVVAKEAKAAFSRGALVLPLIRTGGASAGMFDFPDAALLRPPLATDDQWAQLSTKVSPEDTARAVVDILRAAQGEREMSI
jgi:hypothetical protein